MDSFFQLKEFEFRTDKVTRPYTFLHISDLHLGEYDDESTEEDIEKAEKSRGQWTDGRFWFADNFGDDKNVCHVVPLENYAERFVDLANELKPDALIITGDLVNTYTASNARYVKRLFAKCNVPVLWVKGNHEGNGPEYDELMDGNPDFRVTDIGEVRFILADNSSKKVSSDVVEGFVKAVNTDKYPVLVMHVPFCTEFNCGKMEKCDDYFKIKYADSDINTKKFLDCLESDECPVELYLCGHIHGCLESEFAPGKIQLTASTGLLGGGNIVRIVPASSGQK